MIIIDTETGGLDHRLHPLLSIAVLSPAYPSTEFHMRITPPEHLAIDPHAAKINGYKAETWNGHGEAETLERFREFIHGNDEIIAGCNPGFDVGFISAAYVRKGYREPFWPRRVDVQSLALDAHAAGRIVLPRKPSGQLSFSLDSIAEALELRRPEVVHDALSDARLTWQCIQKLRERPEWDYDD